MSRFIKFAVSAAVLAVAAGLILLKEKDRTPHTGGSVNRTEAAASREVGHSRVLPKLLDLGAGKCIPCKKMAPILEEIKKEYRGVIDVEFIDVWKDRAAGLKYGIRLIPTQIFYDASGRELTRHEGFMGKEDILETFKRFGVRIEEPREK